MKCPQCGQETNDVVCSCGYRFPTATGGSLPPKRFCGNCGAEVTGKFCTKCGAPTEQPNDSARKNFSGYTVPPVTSAQAPGPDVSKNGFAIVGFSLSLLSFLLSAMVTPILIAIVGLVLSIKGRKSQKKKLATAGIVLAILAIIMAVYFAGTSEDTGTRSTSTSSVSSMSSSKPSSVSNTTSASSKSSASRSSSSQSAKAEAKVAGVGDTVEYDGLKFTLDSVTQYVDKSDYPIDKPEAGNIFVLLNFTISNETSEDGFVNMFYEDSYCDDLSIEPEIMLFNASEDTIWGEIAAGKKKKGYIAYQVPSNWTSLEFQYQTVSLISKTDKAIFRVTPQDMQ